MYYINAISSITHQATFNSVGFDSLLDELPLDSEVIKPNYKDFVDAKSLRRMSNIIRMSLANSVQCLNDNNTQIDGIIVGTGFGCLTDTAKFINNFMTIEGLIPPTSFIQSTHNTIAGQISLFLKNNGYNSTYTQNNVSFEMALEDAMMCLDEGMNNVLVGAADECIPILEAVGQKLNPGVKQLTSGSTFLILSKEKNENTLAQVKGVKTRRNESNYKEFISKSLSENGIDKLDLIINSIPYSESNSEIDGVNLSNVVGVYPTNSAFGLHLAVDGIKSKGFNNVMICNRLNENNIGLTVIQSVK